LLTAQSSLKTSRSTAGTLNLLFCFSALAALAKSSTFTLFTG
jgi:hypothetical protein